MAEASTSREEITSNPHPSIDVERLATSISKDIENLPPLSPNCCIYRVLKGLREVKEKAYTPLIISIGPLHHGKQGLEAMEEHKRRYLRDFLEHSQMPIGKFLEFIREREGRIRECYAETINLSSDKFVEIVLVDAAFIIELFLRKYWPASLKSEDDRICGKPRMFDDIRYDLLLLENQIPFFVLEDLFLMANITKTPTFMELTREFLNDVVDLTNIGLVQKMDSSKVEHLIDFLRSCLIASESMLSQQRTTVTRFESIRTATELNEAGVKLMVSSSANIFDIKFSRGVLEVPRIEIYDDTERYLRNLLAFEEFHYHGGNMSDYVTFMDDLINTSNDVELLVKSGVIGKWVGDSEDVSNLFNKLSDYTSLNKKNFHFAQLYKELNDHCTNSWNKWMATLRRDYCNTPCMAGLIYCCGCYSPPPHIHINC